MFQHQPINERREFWNFKWGTMIVPPSANEQLPLMILTCQNQWKGNQIDSIGYYTHIPIALCFALLGKKMFKDLEK